LRGGVSCAGSLELPFVQGSAPEQRAPCTEALDVAVEAGDATVKAGDATVEKPKSWLERLFRR
jgi:hypothetical protein